MVNNDEEEMKLGSSLASAGDGVIALVVKLGWTKEL